MVYTNEELETLKAAFKQVALPLSHSHHSLGARVHLSSHYLGSHWLYFVFKCINVSLHHGTDPAAELYTDDTHEEMYTTNPGIRLW